MKSLSWRHFIVLFIGLAALSFFVLHYFHPTQNPFGLGSDTYEYWHLSENILKHKKFVYTDLSHYPLFEMSQELKTYYAQKRIPCTVRMPGYPFLLASVRFIWDSPWASLFLIYICYIGTCVYGFLIGQFFFNSSRVQCIYNVLLVLSPVYLTRWGVGTDLPASLCLTGFAFHFLNIFKFPKEYKRNIFPLCIWAVASVFIRPNLIVFIGIFIGWAFIEGIIKKQKGLLCVSLILMLAVGGSLGSWILRNQKLTKLALLSTQSGAVLYAVHLSYDLPKTDPLYYWHKQGKEDFFLQETILGKPFNKIESEFDIKLKNIVYDFYKTQPVWFVKKWTDGLRTLFMFSYYDISQLIAEISGLSENSKNIIFQISRVYKIVLAVSFFGFIILLLKTKSQKNINSLKLKTLLYIAVLMSILSTAVFTGAGGDRIRMPFNVFLIVYLVNFWQVLFTRRKMKKHEYSLPT
ncbi:hypothetical protein MNBD_UNCLBAC01-2033 [hydrothermal vent metagenome]|uniref:Uncharacterized protein n=1 Tax=hydrothermal vent metagenome TaxID=652676 RepID=A0A3B1D5T1_9ZZZZ